MGNEDHERREIEDPSLEIQGIVDPAVDNGGEDTEPIYEVGLRRHQGFSRVPEHDALASPIQQLL